ncbi:MAG: hypothetical protein ACTTKP_11045 [Catonella sp.]|uniref:hypothetical protein n=1 Tax=Catonella sp. TaxID=2382125 RepID=UPI003FA140FD
MNLNKKIAKTMVFALGLGAVSFLGNYGARVEAAPSDPKFDNKTGFFTASGTNFWAVAKPVKDVKKANVIDSGNYVIKPADVEAYSAGVNLTALGEGKELYIAYGENNTVGADGKYTGWKVQKIGAASKKFSVYYNGSEHGKMSKAAAASDLGGDAGYLAAEASEGKNTKEIDLATNAEKVFVKAGDGNWATFKDFFGGGAAPDKDKVNARLKALIQRGASLTFRYAADANTWVKEAKLKITAQPKAPKVGVDVQKEEVTSLKKGMQYQVVEKSGNDEPAVGNTWKEVPENKKSLAFSKTDSAIVNTKNYTLFVRNKADKKKVASKIAKIRLIGTADLANAAAIANKPDGVLVADKVDIALVRKFDITKGATITNKSTEDYEVYVDGRENANLPEKAKWTVLKGKKTPEAKDVVLKLKYSKELGKANSYGDSKFKVLIRKAGKKLQNGEATLASAAKPVEVTLGKIAQEGDLTTIAGGNTTAVSKTEVTASYTKGEEKEITFNYKITSYQKFDKKPKLEAVKGGNITVKVDNFVEGSDGSATAIVTVKIGKKATTEETQQIKLSAEGADVISPTIKFTPAS